MKKIVYFFLLLFAVACENGTHTNAASGVNLADYKLEEVPSTNWKRAEKYDSAGNLLEVGYFENGLKTGCWLWYENERKQFPSKLFNYKDGKLNGVHIQFNEGGQTGMIANYQNDQLHGRYSKYLFSRLVEEMNYKNGKLDGVYNIYETTTGKLLTAAEYKAGLQDGFYRTYNTSTGEMTSEYIYQNGQKVSGGAIVK